MEISIYWIQYNGQKCNVKQFIEECLYYEEIVVGISLMINYFGPFNTSSLQMTVITTVLVLFGIWYAKFMDGMKMKDSVDWWLLFLCIYVILCHYLQWIQLMMHGISLVHCYYCSRYTYLLLECLLYFANCSQILLSVCNCDLLQFTRQSGQVMSIFNNWIANQTVVV